MKFLVGGIHQETNTYSPLKETYASFNQYRGQELMEHMYTSPAKLIKQAGHTVVPAVYASIIPSGLLSAEEFEKFTEDFLSYCTDDIDGIWLCLHGAMTVADIGSGEAYLLKKLRSRYGDSMPIFGSFDFHANMSLELVSRMNYITAYYTAPHVDIYETGCRAVWALIHCAENQILPHCRYIPIPMVMPGELMITDDLPAKSIQQKLRDMTRQYKVMELSLFCGFAWSDCPRNRMSITITDDRMEPRMLDAVLKFAGEIWEQRFKFNYGSALAKEPREAVEYAAHSQAPKILISDTGDNVTAGCAGDNALLAELMIKAGLQNALVAGLADKPAVDLCFSAEVGKQVTVDIGGTIDPGGSRRIRVTGILIHRSTFQAEELPVPLRAAVIRCGGVDLLIGDQRYSITSRKRINDTGLSYESYRIIAVKLGYLFPDLAAQKPLSILALTPGNAYQNTGMIPYQNGPEQYFPRDEFTFIPGLDPEN